MIHKPVLTFWHAYEKNNNELPLQKLYLRTCAPSEDLDQPAHSHRSENLLGAFWIAKFLHADNEDSDQTARMRRLN